MDNFPAKEVASTGRWVLYNCQTVCHTASCSRCSRRLVRCLVGVGSKDDLSPSFYKCEGDDDLHGWYKVRALTGWRKRINMVPSTNHYASSQEEKVQGSQPHHTTPHRPKVTGNFRFSRAIVQTGVTSYDRGRAWLSFFFPPRCVTPPLALISSPLNLSRRARFGMLVAPNNTP